MNENIHLGRVVGETEAFVDIELCGHDVRNLLAVHASQCFEMLAPEIREKIGDVLTAYMRGDVAGSSLTARVAKNVYAAANTRPRVARRKQARNCSRRNESNAQKI